MKVIGEYWSNTKPYPRVEISTGMKTSCFADTDIGTGLGKLNIPLHVTQAHTTPRLLPTRIPASPGKPLS